MPNVPVQTGMLVLTTAQGRLSGQTILNTWTHAVEVTAGAPTVDQLYDGMLNDWWDAGASVRTTYLNCLPSDYTMDFLNVQVIYPVRYKRKRHISAGVGGLTEAADQPVTSQVIYRSGDLGSRRDQSSLHLPGTSVAQVDEGVYELAQTALLNALAVKCKTAYAIATATMNVTPVIFHRGPQPTYSIITDAIAKTEVRTMRRRVVGRGI
jgi:hypothetical protein